MRLPGGGAKVPRFVTHLLANTASVVVFTDDMTLGPC